MGELTTVEALAAAAILLDVCCACYLLYLSMALSHNLGGENVGRLRALATVLSIMGAFAKICFGAADMLDGFARVIGIDLGRMFTPEQHAIVAARLAASHLSSAAILVGFSLLLRSSFRVIDTTLGKKRDRLLMVIGKKS